MKKEKKSQTVKVSTDNNTDIFHYMPLNNSKRDTEDSDSIVQTLGAPLTEKRKETCHVLHTSSLCVHEEKQCWITHDKFLTVKPFNCCSRNLFTHSCSTVSTSHTLTHLLKTAQSADSTLNLHCRIFCLTSSKKKKKQNTMICDHSNLLIYFHCTANYTTPRFIRKSKRTHPSWLDHH